MEGLLHQNLKHHHHVKWRPPVSSASRAGRMRQRVRQWRGETLVHNGAQRTALLAEGLRIPLNFNETSSRLFRTISVLIIRG